LKSIEVLRLRVVRLAYFQGNSAQYGYGTRVSYRTYVLIICVLRKNLDSQHTHTPTKISMLALERVPQNALSQTYVQKSCRLLAELFMQSS
jgi:hypothetical protein